MCSNEKNYSNEYYNLLKRLSDEEKININFHSYSSGEQFLFEIEDNDELPDVIYLDLEMGKLSGIDTAKILRKSGCLSEIIFLSADTKKLFLTCDVSPMAYLLKGLADDDKHRQALLRAVEATAVKKATTIQFDSVAGKKKIFD